MRRKVTFIVVVFEAEYPLIEIQGLSFQKFVDAEMIDKIVIITNKSFPGKDFKVPDFKEYFGQLSDLVKVLNGDEIIRPAVANGWINQQILKLEISRYIFTDFYVCLDAKNHFIKPVKMNFFVSEDGRACNTAYKYRNHPLRNYMENVARYFAIDIISYLDHFPATITPFTFRTDRVLSLISDIESKYESRLSDQFFRNGLTEFFLYSFWLVKNGYRLDEEFSFHNAFNLNIWLSRFSVLETNKDLKAAKNKTGPMFSVHRNCFANVNFLTKRMIARFWSDHGLFPDSATGRRFIDAYADYLKRNKFCDVTPFRWVVGQVRRETKGVLRRFGFLR